MKLHLAKSLYAEAAHRNFLGDDKQHRLHGHSYRIEILASGPPNEKEGWVVDFGELKGLFQPILEQIDHGYLNELPGIGDDVRTGGLERWILERWKQLHGRLPAWLDGVRVSINSDLCFVPVRLPACPRQQLPERIGFMFDSAQSLPRLPQGHPCRNLHGHSYHMEAASENLDALQPHLAELHEVLDHRYLNDIEGLDHATCEQIALWVWDWLTQRAARPTVVMVQETPSARCHYHGE